MKKLILFLLLLPMLAMAQQTRPTSPVQKPQNTPYLDTSTGIRWFFDGTVFWPVAPYNPTNMVMSGLSLTVVSNTLTVHTGTWRINNTIYSLGTNTNLTLQARDSVLYHYEAVYATAANNGVGLKVGSTSLTPIQPTVGADTLIVGLVLIAPDGTSVFPPGPASDFVFAHPTVKQLDANPWTRTFRSDTIKVAGQYIFPSRRGLSGQVLQDPGDGNLFWSYQATYLNGFGLNLASQTFSADTFKMVTTTAMMDTLRRNAAHFNPTQFSIVNDTINCVACGLTAVSTNNGISGDGSGPSPVILGGNPLTHSTEIDGTGFDFDIVAGSGNSLAKISLLNNRTINFISRKSATDYATINLNTSGSQNFISLFINTSGGHQKAITMDQGITGIVFSDTFNHIGPIADGNIDTANMTITPKMYVTSEWVLHHTGTGGAFLPLDFAADQTVNQHGHILNLGAPNSLGGAGIHIDSTQFDAHVLDVGGDYGSDLYLDTLSSSLETQGHTRLTAVVLDTINVLVYHKNNLTGDRFEFDATDEASGFGRSNAGVTTLVHVNTAFPGIMVTDNFDHKGLREDSTSIDENNYTDYNYITKRNADSAYVHGVTGGYLPLILPADNTVSLSSHSLYFSTNDGIGTKMFSDGSVVLGATPSQTPLGSTLTITNTPGFGNNFFLAGNFSINNAGIPNTLTPSPHDNSTAVATTAYVDAAVTAGGGISALTGDVTASGTGSVAATLATVNFTTGSFGDGTHVGSFDVNGKGLVTAASSVAISFPVTASNSVTFTNKAGNISQWTNNSGYITTISGVAAGGELAGTYPNPTLLNSAVIAKVLTGYVSGAGTLAATDNILQGFQKLNGNVAVNTTNISSNTTSIAAKANSLVPTAVKTANYTAVVNDFIPVNTTSGNITITLPTAPADKSLIGIKHVVRGGTNTITLTAGGSDVFNVAGGSNTGTITLLNQGTTLQYNASGAIWYSLSTDLALSQLDSRYAASGSGFANPMTTTGDIIYSSSGTTAARLAIGGANTVLHGGTTPSYSSVANADLANSTISGVALGSNLAALSAGTGLTFSNYTGAGAITAKADTGVLQTILNFKPLGNTYWAQLAAVNVFTAANTFRINNVITTPTDAVYIQNNQASTSGVPNQYSPYFRLGARVWNTSGTPADNFVNWVTFVQTTSSGTPTSKFTIASSRTTTSTPLYTNQLTLAEDGTLSTGPISSNASAQALYFYSPATGGTGGFAMNGGNYGLIQNMAAATDAWQIGYGGTPTALGTKVAMWTTTNFAITKGALIHSETVNAINSTATATAAQLIGGYITSTSAAPTTITTSTVAALVTALGTKIAPARGTWFEFTIDNTLGASTVTLALDASMTQLTVEPSSLTVPSGVTGIGTWRVTLVSTTAATISRIQ